MELSKYEKESAKSQAAVPDNILTEVVEIAYMILPLPEAKRHILYGMVMGLRANEELEVKPA